MTGARHEGVLNHVSVTTASLDRALGFYRDLLGFAVLGSGETRSPQLEEIIGLGRVQLRWAELDLGGGQFLELFEYVSPRGRAIEQRTADAGSVHIAFAVPDIEVVYKRLTEGGVVTRSGPVELRTGEWEGAKVLYSLDPDGVTVELIEFP